MWAVYGSKPWFVTFALPFAHSVWQAEKIQHGFMAAQAKENSEMVEKERDVEQN